jgi:NAD(P)-dependent dehydrogenase (short-subunit alcohol dehydrogenase family)
MNTFMNKVTVITGGNSGIGLATTKELSRRGAGPSASAVASAPFGRHSQANDAYFNPRTCATVSRWLEICQRPERNEKVEKETGCLSKSGSLYREA